jgi:chromatin structure-remodeling complex subunit SFH1
MQKPTHQGTYTSYPSRLRTGVSSLLQPLVVTGGPQDGFGATQASLAAATSGYASGSSTPLGSGPELFSRSGRPMRQRVNYAELEGSAGEEDENSQDEQPVLSEAQRQAAIAQARKEKREKEQQMGWSWLGERPPGDRVHGGKAKRPVPDYQRYPILRPK